MKFDAERDRRLRVDAATGAGVFLSVQWWAAWYPGAEPGGGGYVAQRIFSAKTERDGVLATLFFQVAHYAMRPWPWIITGLATVILYPTASGRPTTTKRRYVQAFVDLLPTPWRGLMMAGFAAAYMSTVGTQLNWGASYLVNDFYKRFLNKTASDKHYVGVSRWTTVAALPGLGRRRLAARLGEGRLGVPARPRLRHRARVDSPLVLVARQCVERDRAMIMSAVVSLAVHPFIVARYPADDQRIVAVTMLVTIIVSTITWLAVTYMTKPEPDETLDAFYSRVRPGGRDGHTCRSGSALGASPSPAARWAGRTGSPELLQCTQHCSVSAKSSLAKSEPASSCSSSRQSRSRGSRAPSAMKCLHPRSR